MPKIIISIDGVVLKEVTLAKDHTTLGRRPYNDIVIDNLAVSGEHAVLHMTGGEVVVEDLHSTNGTFVNARQVKRQPLEHNDLIGIGKYKIRYMGAGQTDDAPISAWAPAEPFTSGPLPLSTGVTAPAPLGQNGGAVIRVLSGSGAGRELALQKVVTTIGKPGVAVAAVTRRVHGYVVAPLDGGATLNGAPLGDDAVALQDGDVLELGGTKMQFVHA